MVLDWKNISPLDTLKHYARLTRMNIKIRVKNIHGRNVNDWDMPKSPEKCLDLLEQLRLEAGKFLYEYPARLRRTVKVVRAK